MVALIETPAIVVIGAGPAGLTAAYELTQRGHKPLVVEGSVQIGGISRTEHYKGYHFDIGGHRFYTKVAEVEGLWREMLGAEFRRSSRLSRIYYDGKFYKYPLELFDTLRNIGLFESLLSFGSYALARLRPTRHEKTLEEWVANRFGRRLYEHFFRTYTEKVWGVKCSEIGADWAAQRIQGLSFRTTLVNAIRGGNRAQIKTLIHAFEYPTHGPGQMWEAFAARIVERGGQVCTEMRVTRMCAEGSRITTLEIDQDGTRTVIPATQVISSMPLATLIRLIDPPAPPEILEAARKLRYRDFLIVGLIIDRARMFPDNWLYIHSPEVQVGRIQNFKNWSAAMVPDPTKTSLGMEYFCNQGDTLWMMADSALITLASRELETLGLGKAAEVEDGVVIRQTAAYPFYDMDYQNTLAVLKTYLDTFENLQTVGRNGLHRYNNQDHSMLTGLYAARNIGMALSGEPHETNADMLTLTRHYDLWDVNTERSYQETFLKGSARDVANGAITDRPDRVRARRQFISFTSAAAGSRHTGHRACRDRT